MINSITQKNLKIIVKSRISQNKVYKDTFEYKCTRSVKKWPRLLENINIGLQVKNFTDIQ